MISARHVNVSGAGISGAVALATSGMLGRLRARHRRDRQRRLPRSRILALQVRGATERQNETFRGCPPPHNAQSDAPLVRTAPACLLPCAQDQRPGSGEVRSLPCACCGATPSFATPTAPTSASRATWATTSPRRRTSTTKSSATLARGPQVCRLANRFAGVGVEVHPLREERASGASCVLHTSRPRSRSFAAALVAHCAGLRRGRPLQGCAARQRGLEAHAVHGVWVDVVCGTRGRPGRRLADAGRRGRALLGESGMPANRRRHVE